MTHEGPATMTDLSNLIERVEGLQGPNMEIFDEAFVAVHGPKPERVHGGSKELDDWLTLYNPFFRLIQAGGWLDAALSLVPERGFAEINFYNGHSSNGLDDAYVWTTHGEEYCCHSAGKTPALALVAAALRARGGE